MNPIANLYHRGFDAAAREARINENTEAMAEAEAADFENLCEAADTMRAERAALEADADTGRRSAAREDAAREARQAATREAFHFHRSNGLTAALAMVKAREDVDQGRKRYAESGLAAYNSPCEVGGSSKARWVERPALAGLRFVGWADQCGDRFTRRGGLLDHEGWLTREDGLGGEVLRGAFTSFRARGGRPVFVAAYGDPCNGPADQGGPALFDFERTFEGEDSHGDFAKTDAARAADDFARIAAETEREWNEAWQAGSRWHDLGEDIKAARLEALKLLGELRRLGLA